MKFIKHLVIGLSFISPFIFFYSCSPSNPETSIIKINPNEASDFVNISEIADSIFSIKLQTDSDCIMGRLHDIIIKKKYIYAHDVSQNILFVFDKKGNYISKLDKRGNGPGEYMYMGPIFIDDNEKYIEFVNYSGKKTNIYRYSNITFDFINAIQIPEISANSCKRMNGYYYFATQQISNLVNNKRTNADLIIYDGKRLFTLFDKKIQTNNMGFSPFGESFVINNQNRLFVSIPYINTFYELKNKDSEQILSVDFGKYGINNSIGEKSINEQLEYIEKIKNLAAFPVLNIYSDNIIAFSYYFKVKPHNMFRENDIYQYIIINNKVIHTKRINNDLTDFPSDFIFSTSSSGINHSVVYENYLVQISIPGSSLSEGESHQYFKSIGDIQIDDNPIITFVKLKKH